MDTKRYEWATGYAAKLDALDVARDEIRGEICARDYLPTVKRWGGLIESRGVLRKGDGLRVELCYPSAEFITHSSGAYCDVLYYAIIHRNETTSRATLRLRATIKNDGGQLSYYVDDDGTVRTPSGYITQTDLPDGARKLVNDAINTAWNSLGVSPADIWGECLASAVSHALATGHTWQARKLIDEHGNY